MTRPKKPKSQRDVKYSVITRNRNTVLLISYSIYHTIQYGYVSAPHCRTSSLTFIQYSTCGVDLIASVDCGRLLTCPLRTQSDSIENWLTNFMLHLLFTAALLTQTAPF